MSYWMAYILPNNVVIQIQHNVHVRTIKVDNLFKDDSEANCIYKQLAQMYRACIKVKGICKSVNHIGQL